MVKETRSYRKTIQVKIFNDSLIYSVVCLRLHFTIILPLNVVVDDLFLIIFSLSSCFCLHSQLNLSAPSHAFDFIQSSTGQEGQTAL